MQACIVAAVVAMIALTISTMASATHVSTYVWRTSGSMHFVALKHVNDCALYNIACCELQKVCIKHAVVL